MIDREPDDKEQDEIMDMAHALRDVLRKAVDDARKANKYPQWENAVVGHAIACLIRKLGPSMKGMSKGILVNMLLDLGADAKSGVVNIDMNEDIAESLEVEREDCDGKNVTKH